MIPECVVNKLSDFISRVDREKQEEENMEITMILYFEDK
jgi:hypothetical protein